MIDQQSPTIPNDILLKISSQSMTKNGKTVSFKTLTLFLRNFKRMSSNISNIDPNSYFKRQCFDVA